MQLSSECLQKPAEICLGLLRPLALKLLPEKLLLCLLALERSVWSGDKLTQCPVPNKAATYPFLPSAEAARTIIAVIYGLFLLLLLLFVISFPLVSSNHLRIEPGKVRSTNQGFRSSTKIHYWGHL